jgi:hypothetical protein
LPFNFGIINTTYTNISVRGSAIDIDFANILARDLTTDFGKLDTAHTNI